MVVNEKDTVPMLRVAANHSLQNGNARSCVSCAFHCVPYKCHCVNGCRSQVTCIMLRQRVTRGDDAYRIAPRREYHVKRHVDHFDWPPVLQEWLLFRMTCRFRKSSASWAPKIALSRRHTNVLLILKDWTDQWNELSFHQHSSLTYKYLPRV